MRQTRSAASLRLLGRARRLVVSGLVALSLAGCQSAGSPTDGLMLAAMNAPSSPASTILEAEERGPAVLVVDARSGEVLYEDQSQAPRYPASLTKMMTLYLLFEAVRDGQLSLDDELIVSAEAASKPPAKVGVKAGTTIRVSDAATALAVRSANDVATVVAENVAGSQDAFVARMNQRAQALGMRKTRFVNPSGLPEPGQVTTARDMALLASALRARFPQYSSYFSTEEFRYGGRTFTATNKLLGKVAGVDGMKTGYTRASGFHLVATAHRGSRQLIVVVLGGETGKARDEQVTALLEQYF